MNKKFVVIPPCMSSHEEEILRVIESSGLGKSVEVYITNNPTLKDGQVAVVTDVLKEEIENIDFTLVPPFEQPAVQGIETLTNKPQMPDMSKYFEQLHKTQNKQNKDSLKYRSNFLSKRSKYGK